MTIPEAPAQAATTMHAKSNVDVPGAANARVRRLLGTVVPVFKLGARRVLARKSPFQMTLSLTNRCNFRCTYCDIPLQHSDEMDTAAWFTVIDELHAAGMGRASLIGGEPLLRKDAGEIVRHLKRRGVHASMNTNGWLVPERIDEIRDLDLVCLTLDGPPEVHDRQRNPGSYRKVLRALDTLRVCAIPAVTMTVVTPAGIDHVDHVLDVAEDHGIQAYFQLEHDKDMEVSRPIAPHIANDRVVALVQRLRALKNAGRPVGNSHAALDRQESRRNLLSCDGCHAGSYYGYVFSDGTVSHCIFTRSQVPQRNGQDVGAVRAFRELAPPVGPGCSCVPSYEVNRILDFDARVLFGALETALRRRRD